MEEEQEDEVEPWVERRSEAVVGGVAEQQPTEWSGQVAFLNSSMNDWTSRMIHLRN